MAGGLVRSVVAPAVFGLLAVYAYGTAKYRRNARVAYDFVDVPTPGTDDFSQLLTTLSGSSAVSGNRVQVLRNGDETFGAMLDAIRSATSTVDLSSYIYWPGVVATSFTEALADRARAGVEVNVVLDGWGSSRSARASWATCATPG